MNKLLITILLILAITFSACGSNIPTEQETIKIGVSLPLTGPIASQGVFSSRGIEFALNDINNAGGINNKMLELIIQDDALDPIKAVNNVKSFIDIYNVNEILVTGGNVLTPLEEITKDKSLVLSFYAKTNEQESFVNSFNMAPSVNDEMNKFTSYLFNNGDRKIAIINANNDWGNIYKLNFENNFKLIGGEIIYQESILPSDLDFKTIISKLKNIEELDGIMLLIFPHQQVKFLNEMKELDFQIQIYAAYNVELPAFINGAGDLANGIIYSYPFKLIDNEKTRNFIERYKTDFNEEPEMTSIYAYDSIMLMKQLIEECNDDLECKVNKLKTSEFEGLIGNYSFTEERNTNIATSIKQIVDLKFEVIE